MSNLAAPGAGLPKPELLIANVRFRLKCWLTSDQDAIEEFKAAKTLILQACETYDQQQASTPVLIKRLRGLEDSSRDWSIYMTVEHLRIVNDAIRNIFLLLSQGSTPPNAISTADVKPSPETGNEVIKTFDESCCQFVETLSTIGELKTATKFDHPWFGPLDASRWLVLAAFHMHLHLAQIQRIGKGLSKS